MKFGPVEPELWTIEYGYRRYTYRVFDLTMTIEKNYNIHGLLKYFYKKIQRLNIWPRTRVDIKRIIIII